MPPKNVEGAGASKETPKLPGGISQSQLNAWKAAHGDVYALKAAKDDQIDPETKKPVNVVTGWFKKPDLDTLSQVLASQHDQGNAIRIMVQNTFIGGDKEDIFGNEEVMTSMHGQLNRLFKIRVCEVEKF